jgi:hypothetical protein
MRFILVILISGLVLWYGNEALGQDLFLVEIVSVDKEAKRAVVQILDGPENLEELPDARRRFTLHGDSLSMAAQPGDIFRLWGDISDNGEELIVKEALRTGRGSDPTGVRRRLRNNTQNRGQGRRGGGRGGF